MDVTFFAEKVDCEVSSFAEIPEGSILGGGNFTKEHIGDLLSCFKSSSSALSDSLWLLPINFSEELSIINDDKLKIYVTNNVDNEDVSKIISFLFSVRYDNYLYYENPTFYIRES